MQQQYKPTSRARVQNLDLGHSCWVRMIGRFVVFLHIQPPSHSELLRASKHFSGQRCSPDAGTTEWMQGRQDPQRSKQGVGRFACKQMPYWWKTRSLRFEALAVRFPFRKMVYSIAFASRPACKGTEVANLFLSHCAFTESANSVNHRVSLCAAVWSNCTCSLGMLGKLTV